MKCKQCGEEIEKAPDMCEDCMTDAAESAIEDTAATLGLVIVEACDAMRSRCEICNRADHRFATTTPLTCLDTDCSLQRFANDGEWREE